MENLVVDGYNVIHAWDSLRTLLPVSLEAARDALIDRLAVYGQMTGSRVTVVFDAHQTAASQVNRAVRDGVYVVFTRRRESADHLIERIAYDAAKQRSPILVASSDRFHRDMLRGMGAAVIDAGELERRVLDAERSLRDRLRRGEY